MVQDYALVIATADQTLTNALTVVPMAPSGLAPLVQPTFLTNGVPLLNRRVGPEDSPLLIGGHEVAVGDSVPGSALARPDVDAELIAPEREHRHPQQPGGAAEHREHPGPDRVHARMGGR